MHSIKRATVLMAIITRFFLAWSHCPSPISLFIFTEFMNSTYNFYVYFYSNNVIDISLKSNSIINFNSYLKESMKNKKINTYLYYRCSPLLQIHSMTLCYRSTAQHLLKLQNILNYTFEIQINSEKLTSFVKSSNSPTHKHKQNTNRQTGQHTNTNRPTHKQTNRKRFLP